MFKMWKYMDTTSRKSKTMSEMQITILEQTKKKGGEKMKKMNDETITKAKRLVSLTKLDTVPRTSLD